MSDTDTTTRTTPAPPTTARVRHIVARTPPPESRPEPACLCGYVWDVYPVAAVPGAPVCEECQRELVRREARRARN